MDIPVLTTQQMIEVDRLMVEEYGIQLIQMMENAGRSLAVLARQMLGEDAQDKRIALVCGGGSNGGGGMVAARHLHNWGARVSLALAVEPARLKEIPAHQLRILERVGIARMGEADLNGSDLVIDALIGYGLRGSPDRQAAGWIEAMNSTGSVMLSLDAPSGLDTTTGAPGQPCVRAAATLTLALPKTGLLTAAARPYVGALYLADIGVPPELYRRMGIEVPPLFSRDAIRKLEFDSTAAVRND